MVGLFIDFLVRFIIYLVGYICSRVVLVIFWVKDFELNYCYDVMFVDDRVFCVYGLI